MTRNADISPPPTGRDTPRSRRAVLCWPVILAGLLALPQPGLALSLDFHGGAERTGERRAPLTSYDIALSAFGQNGAKTLRAEGQLVQESWQLPQQDATTLQILTPLRDQLAESGFDILFECADQTCGGFDFRYATDVLPEPAMHVDLGDFRYLAGKRGALEQTEYVTLLVSRSPESGFVQLVHVAPPSAEALKLTTSTKGDAPDGATPPTTNTAGEPLQSLGGDLAAMLERDGYVVLDGLDFETGSATLTEGDNLSLADLATYLNENPQSAVTLVGHTDMEGALDSNMALSKRRAQAVRDALITRFGAPADQIDAAGIGYLSPMASNLTDAGRTQNRRVEAILTSTR